MKQIIRIRMNELRNSEHPLVVYRIVSIVKKHDPETLLIQASLLRVESHLPMLAKVEARSRQHSLTKLLTELDGKRDNLTNALYRQVRVMKQVKIPELAAHAIVLKEFFDVHGWNIPRDNYTAQTNRTRIMIAQAEATPDVVAAFEALHLQGILQELKSANEEFDLQFMSRTEDRSGRDLVDVRSIRAQADKDVHFLFSVIEGAKTLNPQIDYMPVINELNDLLGMLKAGLSSRKTRRTKPGEGEPVIVADEETELEDEPALRA